MVAICVSIAALPAKAAAFSQDDIAMIATEPSAIVTNSPIREAALRTAGRSRSMYDQKTKIPTETAIE